MPVYVFRCSDVEWHKIELTYRWGQQPKEIECPVDECDGTLRQIITTCNFSVDNTDRQDFSMTAGRNFSNKGEMDAWLKSRNLHVIEDGELNNDMDKFNADKELYHEVVGRGEVWEEFSNDREAQKKQKAMDKLKALGVSLQPVSAEEFKKADAKSGWESVDDSHRVGEPVFGDVPVYSDGGKVVGVKKGLRGYRGKQPDKVRMAEHKAKLQELKDTNYQKYADVDSVKT